MTAPLAGRSNRLVGSSVRRKEDPRLLRGRGSFVDDLARPGMLHAAFFRSDLAHGRLKLLEVNEAAKIPGVVGVYTATELAPYLRPLIAKNSNASYQPSEIPILAREKVIFAGQPVAIVVAESRHEAEDGVDAIRAEYEPLPPVLDVEAATALGAPLVHDNVRCNAYNHFHVVHGDIDSAFAKADLIIEMDFRHGRCAAVPLEGRVVLADWDPLTNTINVWTSHQAPHLFRTGIAEVFGVGVSEVRVVSPDVGGGFGVKLAFYPEDVATIAASRLVGRPVKWMCDRREDLITTIQGREQIHQIRAAATNDGRILGVKATIRASNGAYAIWPFTAGLDSGQASENVPGPYNIAAYEREVYAVATNKAPMGPYRGVGRIAACFSIERTIDEIAHRLGLDPIEVRRRNVVRTYPHTTIAGLQFESGSSAETLDQMEQLLNLPQLRRENAKLRKENVYRGVGLAAIVEHSALGPKYFAARGGNMALSFETACVRVEPDGRITLLVGTHSHGQGHETTFAQLVADEFSIGIDKVSVRFGDTAAGSYGLGTWASRSLVFVSGAATLASRDVKSRMIKIAAHVLKRPEHELVHADGAVMVASNNSQQVSLQEIARIANLRGDQLPEELDTGLEATRRYRAPDPGTFSNSLHAAVVEVDVRTGAVAILRYVVIEDCGTLVNPLIVDGQIIGGVAQGIGQALLEEAHYDSGGQPTAATLADYLVPTAGDIPRIEIHHRETPSPHTLGGFKGMGEGGAVNPPAAIANAVTDALSPFGVRVNHLPITPEWIAMMVAGSRAGNERRT
jgi:aerobic carbon-monoxide dehydrogenase large subunit